MRTFVHLIPTFCAVIFISVLGIASISAENNIEYVGCYDPSYALRQKYHYHMPSVLLGGCVQQCQLLKTRFAGVESSDNFCYCGVDIGEMSVQRNDTMCNVPCPDQPLKTCGGDWLLSLYEIRGASSKDATDDVDFLVGISTGVRLYHKGGITTASSTYDTLLTTTDWDWVYSVDYHFTKNLLFAFTKRKNIVKTVLNPKLSTGANPANGTLIRNVGGCEGFAVDWVHDRLYWANCSADGTTIMSCGLDGEAEETVLMAKELNWKTVKRMEIDPYKGVLFWTANFVLQSVGTSGENFNPTITIRGMIVRAFALDIQSRRIHYIGALKYTYALYSIDYSGGQEVEHFRVPQFWSVYGLSIIGNKMFWVNWANDRDVIYEAPINLTSAEEVNMLRSVDRAVWHMRVVHPALQTRPKIDPCLDKGCEHTCVTSSATSAKCRCAPGQTLNYDGVSCRDKPTSDRLSSAGPGVVALSVLLVIAVLVTSAVLVYVWDKYWAMLGAKLSGISYFRSRGRDGDDVSASPTDYQTGEDSVTLI